MSLTRQLDGQTLCVCHQVSKSLLRFMSCRMNGAAQQTNRAAVEQEAAFFLTETSDGKR